MYAILAHGGRQHRVTAGDRIVVDRLDAEPGTVVHLEPVLFTADGARTALGRDLEGVRVAASVVQHLRGEKIRVFKYRAKKRTRRTLGHRSDLTELIVEAILARGEEHKGEARTPRQKAAAPRRRPAKRASSRGRAASPSRTRAAKPASSPRKATGATAGKSAAAKPAAKRRAATAAPKRTASSKAASRPATSKRAAAKPAATDAPRRTGGARRPATKTASKATGAKRTGGTAAKRNTTRRSGDGA